MVGQMDNGMRYYACMWRESNDDYYRIETNSPKLIRKLQKRITASPCGRTMKGSTKHFRMFQLKYNKPNRALNGFRRITSQDSIIMDADGDFFADMGPILDKKRAKIKGEVCDE